MSTEPVFQGTPDDWWEQAERITDSHAENRKFGDWYISRVRQQHASSDGGATSYRVSTPSRPSKETVESAHAKYFETHGYDRESEYTRRLIRSEEEAPAWMTAQYVIADTSGTSSVRAPWVRKSGKWQLIIDGRVNVSDRDMAERNPEPASFVVSDLI